MKTLREIYLTNELNQKMADYRRAKRQTIKMTKEKGYVIDNE